MRVVFMGSPEFSVPVLDMDAYLFLPIERPICNETDQIAVVELVAKARFCASNPHAALSLQLMLPTG